MRLLQTIHLPRLPFEALRPRWSEAGAYAVIDRDCVLVASDQALPGCVRAGMRVGGVLAVASFTVLLERSLDKEQAVLEGIAMARNCSTPRKSHIPANLAC